MKCDHLRLFPYALHCLYTLRNQCAAITMMGTGFYTRWLLLLKLLSVVGASRGSRGTSTYCTLHLQDQGDYFSHIIDAFLYVFPPIFCSCISLTVLYCFKGNETAPLTPDIAISDNFYFLCRFTGIGIYLSARRGSAHTSLPLVER